MGDIMLLADLMANDLLEIDAPLQCVLGYFFG